jgi:hypothetical protein
MKTLVLATCNFCNSTIAGGWYESENEREKEEMFENVKDWVKRGFVVKTSDNSVEVILERHKDNCPRITILKDPMQSIE